MGALMWMHISWSMNYDEFERYGHKFKYGIYISKEAHYK
jgi:hypothetical protein